MHGLIKHIGMAIIIGLCLGTSAFAVEGGTADEAVAMVQKAIAFMKKNGLEQTIAEVNNPKGQFVDRDLYVTIVNTKGINLAHGANPKMVGKDLSDLRDVDGNYISRQRVEILKTRNAGWIKFRWLDPLTKQIEPKSQYFEKADDVVVSCGIYQR